VVVDSRVQCNKLELFHCLNLETTRGLEKKEKHHLGSAHIQDEGK
jgi:hypothetical protein